MSDDPRKDYLARTIVNHFGSSSSVDSAFSQSSDDMQAALCRQEEMDLFLEDPTVPLLQASLVKAGSKFDIHLANAVSATGSPGAVIHFTKVGGSDNITMDNIQRSVVLSSMAGGSAVTSLYTSLHNIFLPMLEKDKDMDPLLKDLLRDLEVGLGKVMRKPDARGREGGLDSIVGILSLEDEVAFWRDQRDSADRADAEVGEGVFKCVETLAGGLKACEEGSLENLIDEVEFDGHVAATLEELYRGDDYPAKRMRHLLKLVGDVMVRVVQAKLAASEVWLSPIHKAEQELDRAREVLTGWRGSTDKLCREWKWKDNPEEKRLTMVQARVGKIRELRRTQAAIQDLLSPEELAGMQVEAVAVFQRFSEIKSILNVSPHADALWASAVGDFDRSMEHAEGIVLERLKDGFVSHLLPAVQAALNDVGSAAAQPYQLLKQFFKHRELLARPVVARQLVPQREQLLKLLDAYMRKTKEVGGRADAHAEGKGPEQFTGKNLSGVVNAIVFLAQLHYKVVQILEAARPLVSDLPNFEAFEALATDTALELSDSKEREFKDWQRTTLAEIKDKKRPLKLDPAGASMSFEKGEDLKVHFDERLVNLVRDARQFRALGLKIPKEVDDEVTKAQRYYHSATVLKQVASVYNTMNSSIIPVQFPMLLEEAKRFEQLVADQDKDPFSWEDPPDKQGRLETYIESVDGAMQALRDKNRVLRKAHEANGQLVVRMMNTDLVRQLDRWKAMLAEMRANIEVVESEGTAGTAGWRTHWNFQLAKALEFQYKLGLESCHETLPAMGVKLVFKDKKLCFDPPFEEVRKHYYKELKTFIMLPSKFTGVAGEGGDAKELFKKIVDRNSKALVVVFSQAEKLFRKLSEVGDKFEKWVALGSLDDIGAFVEENLKEVEDWENNLRLLKTRARDVDKLESEEKVDCITVDTRGVKSAAEEQLRELDKALGRTLRNSGNADVETLHEFVKQSLEALSVMPQSVDEIAAATEKWRTVTEQLMSTKDLKMRMEDKGRLLKLHTGQTLDGLQELNKDWDDLELRMTAHTKNVEEQKERIRALIAKGVKDYQEQLKKFASVWKGEKPDGAGLSNRQSAEEAMERLRDLEEQYEAVKMQGDRLVKDCAQFGIPEPRFSELEDLEEDVGKTVAAWKLYSEYATALAVLTGEKWLVFLERIWDMDDFLAGWAASLKGREVDAVVRFLHGEIERLKTNWPFLKLVKGDSFTGEHWAHFYALLELKPGMKLAELTLQVMLDKSDLVVKKIDKIKDLQAKAVAELTMKEALDEIDDWGIRAEFKCIEHQDASGRKIALIKEWKEVQTAVGDHQSVLQAMRDSPCFEKFRSATEDWDAKLSVLAMGLNDLNAVQRKWLYLEPIFGRGALPAQQDNFKRVNDHFRSIMSEVEADTHVIAFAKIKGVTKTLSDMLDQLDRCQKALSDFLEEKRSKFPRFYFIGDDDLLEILGQAQNPEVIQAHLKKLFQAIFAVVFSDDTKSIVAFRSLEGEMVDLLNAVPITETVEDWLALLADEMVLTLKRSLVECLPTLDLNAFPSMIVCAAEQITFCDQAEKALRDNSMAALQRDLARKLEEYTGHGQDTDPVVNLKLKAVILDIIHDLDVVDQMQKNNVKHRTDWYWHKQLRYYMEDQCCMVRMCDALNAYTYEYQGNDAKLVHTPLTDKCYLTLTQGLHLGYGGNPYGPAGTGKTESVKALGQALARQVLVFNCDEGIDYKSMGRIFTGLVKCGAWGCFDEFNRLEAEVLSAVSQQIQTIQAALKEKRTQVNLLGTIINVNPNSGIFVTLNPAGKGYGGRSELPDNLKQLFRSVAMAAPDNALIGEVILYAEGYKHAKIVGTKVVELFTLSKQLLSKQQHYDWGLRALKTILLISGKLITMERKAGKPIELKDEMELVIKAVRLNTLAKLTFQDTHRFEALIKDIFPGTEVKDAVYADLEAAIRASLVDLKLDPLDSQVKKVVQLNENLNQRMGCVIVGPSGCGKSALLRILRSALARMGQKVLVHTMNPKAMPRQQLLGHMDMDTREWFDGVLTASARLVVKEPPDVRSWIVCDGDIDPEWVESLNSVLDDNRLLTMPSGERIRFGPNVNFIFETNDLKSASPATVSRMGMIFLSDEDMDPGCLVRAWLSRQPEAHQGNLQAWIGESFDKGLKWVLKRSKSAVVATTRVGVVLTALSHLVRVECKEQFAAALVRGLGSNLPDEVRTALAKEVWEWLNEKPIDTNDPLSTYFDTESKTLRAYSSNVDTELSSKDMAMSSPTERDLPVVQTADLRKASDLFSLWLDSAEPFLLVGPEGCGKSMLLRNAFQQRKNYEVATINCNAQTSAIHVIQKLQQSCTVATAQSGRVFRPKAERLILYLKDVNLPKPDKYGTMQLIAFLQQLVLYQGFYDNLEWMGIEKVQIVCSMNPSTTVGRHQLTTRFTAILRIASITYPARETLQQVYSAYLSAVLCSRLPKHPDWGPRKTADKLASTLLDFFEGLKERFSVDDFRHYLFTPRDITTLVVGLLRYDVNEVHPLDALSYEAGRIFRDRLVGENAAREFDGQVWGNLIRSQWGHKVDLKDASFTTWLFETDGELGDGGAKMVGRASSEDLKNRITDGLIQYEREFKELGMLLFPEIVARIARLDRVLSAPGGSALLIGRPGVGRRTCVTLACYMHDIEIVTPKMGRDYGAKQFLNDIKGAVTTAGAGGLPMALYLEDFQLVDAAFLEIVNSLLSSGEAPGMFTAQELEGLMGPLKEEYSSQGYYKFRNIYAFFVSRVQKNLHIIISLDPQHPDFLLRCESNPALYTQCTIMWLEAWSGVGMAAVPKMHLKDILADIPEPDQLVEDMQFVHETMVQRGAAPRQYVTLINTMTSLYHGKRSALTKQTQFLQGGLTKLAETAVTVKNLSGEAVQQETVLRAKQKEAKEKMVEITANVTDAGRKKAEAEDLSKKLVAAQSTMEVKKRQVKGELAECEPVLEEARAAVGNIKKDNLNEIRSLKLPPEPIRDVLEGVLRLMNNQDTSWISMKKFLSQTSVIQDILTFDAKVVTPEIREAVRKLMTNKAASFQAENIQRVSQAAAPMAAWVKAQMQYSLVLEKIRPLTSELEKLDTSLESAMKRKRECEKDIQQSDEAVKTLSDEYETLLGDASNLNSGLEKVKTTLFAAEDLLGKLNEENDRWKIQMQDLVRQQARLPVTILMAASFMTYLGGAPEDTRQSVTSMWMKRFDFPEFRFLTLMSSETERLTWKAQGLPGDDLSEENAIVILNSKQYPLIIDPSSQAAEWLKKNLEASEQSVEVTTQQAPNFLQKLELSVRFGKTLVIQEVDRVEALMLPLLRRDLVRQGPRWVVQIGDKMIDFNEGFRLYMITRNPGIEIQPDARPLLAEVNFSVTRSGLEGQLLGVTIQHERPKLETDKSELLKKEEEMKLSLSSLEKDLLEQLASSGDNILENKPLIEKLTLIKVSSHEIKEALVNSAKLQVKLDEERDVYRMFARAASGAYFLIQSLKSVNYMYQFDLPTYITLFKLTLSNSQSTAGEDVSGRLRSLISTLKRNIFTLVGRALFKGDRLTFGMHLVNGMHPEVLGAGQWDFMVGLSVADISQSNYGVPGWVPSDRAPALQRLAASMPALVQNLGFEDEGSWKDWLSTGHPEEPRTFPPKAQTLTAFQKILLVQALRPDRLQSAMETFTCDQLGLKSINLATLDLSLLAKETKPTTPIMFIITPGADPSVLLEQAADRALGPGKYRQLAMGQGQSELALNLLATGAEEGAWVCLQNVHLVVSWLPVLEKTLHGLKPDPNFRLWLTTEPHPRFPPILLQLSSKITFEAPPGLKKNLQNAYSIWPSTMIGSGTKARAQLLFVVAWFHAVVQERRTFIPQGWSKFHEFSFADLRSTADIVQSIDADNPPWETLHGLLDNAIYGGRIDNIFDQRILRTALRIYYKPENIGMGNRAAQPLPNTRGKLGPDKAGVVVPDSMKKDEYQSIINQLPDVDEPSLFGLPPNIERVVQQANSAKITSQLKTMATADVAASGWDRERMAAQMDPVLRLWAALTGGNPVLKPGKGLGKAEALEMPVDSFIAMEAENAVAVVTMVNTALEAISRVLKGQDLLTTDVKNTASSLAGGNVPDAWSDAWEGPDSPPMWLQAVVKKKLAIDAWLERAVGGATLQDAVSLSAMFNPGVFLNALRQQTARVSSVAVDDLKLVCQWGEAGRSGVGKLPCAISGLALQGALFTSGSNLADSRLDTPTVVGIPQCTIAYIPKKDEDPIPDKSSVELPVYDGLDRAKFLCQLRMPCKAGEQDKWVMCGAAIFLSTE